MKAYLMEIKSGAVDTVDGWESDFSAHPEWQEDADLVEVLADPDGGYVGIGDFSHYDPIAM